MTLADLEQRRAAIVDDDALPASATRAELTAHQRRRAALNARITAAENAAATLASLPSADADETWLAQLHSWRRPLCDELLALPPRIRDKQLLGVQTNITLSIRVIDFGLEVLREQPTSLPTLRLGQLMIASGLAITGADPAAQFIGTLPWRGSIKEVEKRLAILAKKRAAAEAQLAAALVDDAVRTEREAEDTALREAFNSMRVRMGADGTLQGPAEMTDVQRRSFEGMTALHGGKSETT